MTGLWLNDWLMTDWLMTDRRADWLGEWQVLLEKWKTQAISSTGL